MVALIEGWLVKKGFNLISSESVCTEAENLIFERLTVPQKI